MTTFLKRLRDIVNPNLEAQREAQLREEQIATLMLRQEAKALIEYLEGLHAEDYVTLRSVKGEEATAMVRGQAARTDEVLRMLRGAQQDATRRKVKNNGRR